MKRKLIGLTLIVVGAGLVASARRRGRRSAPFVHGPGAETDLEAAPLLVVRGAVGDVSVVVGDGPAIHVRAFDVGSLDDAVRVRRVEDDEDGPAVVLGVYPRRRIEVTVPRGTAVRLRAAKGRIVVDGVDDVDVRSAKTTVVLRDVGGAVRIRSAMGMVDVNLSRERETRSVDVGLAKSRFTLVLPAARGGTYTVRSAMSLIDVPPSVAGGIPVAIRAAKAQVAIHAA